MNILAIETATSICGIALFFNGTLVGIVEEELDRQHAKKLPQFFDKLRSKVKFNLSDLDGIAISIGPGSFTGLRIGLSYGKGLAFSSGIPIIPVSTLETLVKSSRTQHNNVRCIIHSHRNFVYYQDYLINHNAYDAISHPKSVSWDEMINSLTEKQVVYQFGCNQFVNWSDKKTNFFECRPSAKWVGIIAIEIFDEKKLLDYHMLEPQYVSDFIISKKN